MPLLDPGRASLRASRIKTGLGRSLALPKSRKAIESLVVRDERCSLLDHMGLSCKMAPSRHRLTLMDLMAAVAAAGLGLGWIVSTMPGQGGPAALVIGPLVGIFCDRFRGGRGILGGTLGGAAYVGFALIMLVAGAHWPREAGLATTPDWPVRVVITTAICLTFGTLMGVAAWLVAAVMERFAGGRRAEPK